MDKKKICSLSIAVTSEQELRRILDTASSSNDEEDAAEWFRCARTGSVYYGKITSWR